MVNKRQIFIGVTTLMLGTLVYLVDRSPDQTYFVYRSGINIGLHGILPNLFGFVGNSFPTFIHVFSFILMTAGLIAYRKRDYVIICLGWFCVDCVFELGQKYSRLAAKLIPDWLAGIPFLENTKNYFLHGTFDPFDLVFITVGAVTAYLVSTATMNRRRL